MPKFTKEKKDISVVERRLTSGAVFRTGSKPIPLVEPDRWTLREVNSAVSDQHLYEMQAEKGWIYASKEDLAVPPVDVGYREQDGRLVKGQQGQIVLMKMLKRDYVAIQKAKTEANIQQTFSRKANKQAIIGALAAEHGDQAASTINDSLNDMTLVDQRQTAAQQE